MRNRCAGQLRGLRMDGQQYQEMLQWLRKRPFFAKVVTAATRGLPAFFALGYIGTCLALLLLRDSRLLRFAGVPAVTLGVVLVLRKFINRTRPYEVYGFQPLITRDKKGKSCPSNHTASAFVIALAFLYLSVPAGIIGLALAAAVAGSRVVTGVHWPGDVLAGALVAVLLGYIGLWIL